MYPVLYRDSQSGVDHKKKPYVQTTISAPPGVVSSRLTDTRALANGKLGRISTSGDMRPGGRPKLFNAVVHMRTSTPNITAFELVVQVGSTQLSYQLRALNDCVAMLKSRGDWVALGNADEGKPTPEGSVEAWARDASNPVGGYYGLRKGYRGRFANYVTPVLEPLGHVELEHGPRNNRVRSLG